MFQSIRSTINWVDKTWREHGFEMLVLLSLIVIFIYWITRWGKRGTWTTHAPEMPPSFRKPRRPPQESKGEIECRRVLQSLFKKPFPKARPNILRNPVTSENGFDNNLELDCYNEELKLACEYQGIQHYKYIPYFHRTRDAFTNQKYRDHMKKEMCMKNGIRLIEVPYTVKVPDIESYIRKKINDLE